MLDNVKFVFTEINIFTTLENLKISCSIVGKILAN